MDEFPTPGSTPAVVVAPAPGAGPGFWAGGSSAVVDGDTIVLAYRLRHGHDGRDQTVVARSDAGQRFTTLAAFDGTRFGAAWMERPALVRVGANHWRLWICLGSPLDDPGSKRWWVQLLEAADPADFADATVLPGIPGGDLEAVKDPYVRLIDDRYHAWVCVHHLDIAGAEDRMCSTHLTSDDGVDWTSHGTVLSGQPGEWDARGARVTTVLNDGRVAYDGRASAEENWFERSGIAAPDPSGTLRAVPGARVADVRYLDVVELPGGGYRLFYEARLPDESHELRTEVYRPTARSS